MSNQMVSEKYQADASPAFRGYRHQAEYILYRILMHKADESSFCPEFSEDLTIFNNENNVKEIIQIKDYTANLTLSTFLPANENSFFNRMAYQLQMDSNFSITIASFGNIGPELEQAINSNGKDRENICHKIEEYGHISYNQAQLIFNKLQIEKIDEIIIEKTIKEHIRKTCLGIDIEVSYEVLSYFIFICSENKKKITNKILIDKINHIGNYLSEMTIFQKEWHSNIVSFNNLIDTGIDYSRLQEEFYNGVSARYNHIYNNLDIPREHKVKEIHDAFLDNNIVIIHGASGQGKTTLALRYFHDYFNDYMSYKIIDVDNSSHAHMLSNTLANQQKSLGMTLYLYIDVQSGNDYWLKLANDISQREGIKILITIREEDWRRLNTQYDFKFKDLELELNKEEAGNIFNKYTKDKPSGIFIDFEDCWKKFDQEQGPLLEFVFLLNQGITLKERLKKQIKNLQDRCNKEDISEKVLELLRIVSVVSAYKGSLDIKKLQQILQFAEPQRAFELLEKEYLLRCDKDGLLVNALHPLRSMILTELLIDDVFYPWIDIVKKALPAIHEPDIEIFLLYSFSRQPAYRDQLIELIKSYSPPYWFIYSGIIHALLWVGVKKYVEENRELIEKIYDKEGSPAKIIFNSDITDVTENRWWNGLDFIEQETIDRYNSYSECQTDQSRAFIPLKKWLENPHNKPGKPQSDHDFLGIGETIFWSDYLKINSIPESWEILNEIDKKFENLDIETISNITLGISLTEKDSIKNWYNSHLISIKEKLCKETNIVAIEENHNEIKAHFFLPCLDEYNEQFKDDTDMIHSQTMYVIDYLRKLFPFYKTYSSQGYGHMVFYKNVKLDFDPSYKCIEEKSLPITWLVSINSIVFELIQKYFRPANWDIYIRLLIDKRKLILQKFIEIVEGIDEFYRCLKPSILINDRIRNKWNYFMKKIETDIILPLCSLDEWGLNTEQIQDNLKSPNNIGKNSLNDPSLKKYKKLINQQNDFYNFVNCFFWNFTNNITSFITNNKLLDNCDLTLTNLTDVIKRLNEYQIEFKTILISHCNAEELNQLEEQEQKIYSQFWALWYHFIYNHTHKKKNAIDLCYKDVHHSFPAEFKHELMKKIRRSSGKFSIDIIDTKYKVDNKSVLWLKIHHSNISDFNEITETIIQMIDETIIKLGERQQMTRKLYYHWDKISIISIIHGKILLPIEKRVLSLGFFLKIAKFSSYPLPDDTIKNLGLEKWDTNEILPINNLANSLHRLLLLMQHIAELDKIPEKDCHYHSDNMNNYFLKIKDMIMATIEIIKNEIHYFICYYNDLNEEEKEKRVDLIDALSIIQSIKNILEVDGWAAYEEKINTLQIQIFLLYSSLTTDYFTKNF